MGCDSSDTGYIQFGLFKQSIAGGSEDLVFIGGPFSTGLSETPGCLRYTVTTAPAIINNASLGHGLLVQQFGDTTGALRFYGIGIRYRLQVSPSPASASFGDVPTDHPLFQFVEALASAGITGGCGGGNYCPDAPITRGQMAVFLSVALGLHFPN
jgi:hypothetical protein